MEGLLEDEEVEEEVCEVREIVLLCVDAEDVTI